MTPMQSDRAWLTMYDGLLDTIRAIPPEDTRRRQMWENEVRRVECAAARSEIRRVGLDPWANEARGLLWPKEL